MNEKMMFDRIKLQINLNKDIKENIEEIEAKIEERGKFIKKTNNFENFYMIKRGFFNLYYYKKNKFLILDFNMQRFFTDVNIGGVSNKEALRIINLINYYLENEIGIKKDIRDWVVNNIELKKDIKYINQKQKDAVIATYKKCTKCNMKTGNYESGYYRSTRSGNKINVYDKEKEVMTHNDRGRIGIEEKALVHDVIRFEVAFREKKLRKMLQIKDKVVFKNILNIKIQKKIFNEYFMKLGFTVGFIPTKINLINKIKKLGFSERKTKNLIKFIEAINKYTFNKAKELFPSIYVYLKILKENNLPVYFLNIEEIEVLQKKIKDNKENKIIIELKNKACNKLYNIYNLFDKKLFLDIPKLE